MIGITKYEVPVSLMNEKKEGCCLIDAKDLSRGSSSPDMAALADHSPESIETPLIFMLTP